MAGGVPAGEAGLRAFIHHHLGIIEPDEAQAAYERIVKEEMGERPVPSAEGELQEKLSYGVNVIRRTELGPFLGNWMIHACLKTAASRLNIFKDLRGSKGNFAEAGKVSPSGISTLDDRFDRIYLIGRDGLPVQTYFEEFKGRVQSPKGSVSVVHHSECVPAGTRFEFGFQFIMGELTEGDIGDFLALAMIVGLGSVKSLGNGKFRINSAELINPVRAPGLERAQLKREREKEKKKLEVKA